jgi:hypothetical protein
MFDMKYCRREQGDSKEKLGLLIIIRWMKRSLIPRPFQEHLELLFRPWDLSWLGSNLGGKENDRITKMKVFDIHRILKQIIERTGLCRV